MLIFCASSGRAGTRFFKEVFSALTDIPSYHENWPKCINVVNEDLNNNEGVVQPNTTIVLQQKVKSIRKIAEKTGSYFESNHMFIKAFCPAVLNAFPGEVYCIYINRNIADMLFSYTQRGRRARFPMDFQLNPGWAGNVLRTAADYGFYETVVWNYFEVKERFRIYKSQFVKTYEFDFEKINDLAEWYRLFDHFGIEAKKVKRLPELYKHSSNITPVLYPSIFKHLRENWHKKGSFNFISDVEKLSGGKRGRRVFQ